MIVRARIYTGPTLVEVISEKLKDAGFAVTLTGTAHVYIETDRTREDILAVLGPTWKYRDISFLGTV